MYVRRPLDANRDLDLTSLLASMGIRRTLELFSALLMEEKIAVVAASEDANRSNSKILSHLVSCCDHILSPFSWQHTLIPSVPDKLAEMLVQAPTPFLVGISSPPEKLMQEDDGVSDLKVTQCTKLSIDTLCRSSFCPC